jgi:hypothetical protein
MKPPSDYRVVLAAKNEGVDYMDDSGVYHFDVSQTRNEWTLIVPPSKGQKFEPHELTPDEEARILPRVTKYLSRIRWFGVFPRSYSVRIVREPFGADVPHAN